MRTGPLPAILAVLSLAGCASEGPTPIVAEHLGGRPIVQGTDRILKPDALVVVDGRVIVADDEAPFLRAFSLDDGRPFGTAGGLGDGPDEFRMITSLSVDRSDPDAPAIVAFDGRHQQATRWIIVGTDLVPDGIPIRLTQAGSPMRVVADGIGGFVGVGAFADSAFTVHDRAGTLIRRGGSIPFVSEQVTPVVAQQVILPRPGVRPGGGRLALTARHAGRIDLYDLVTGERTTVDAPDPFEPVITTTDNGAMQIFATDGQTRFGYVDVAASECCIFGLFSGRTRAGSPGKVSFGRDIHVFDWQGRQLRHFTVEEELLLIAIDPDGRTLLGLALDPEPAIHRYDLPE